MNFLRTLFWVVLAVIAVIFAMRNWTPVSVALWGGFVAETKLPVLMALAFLIGLLPPAILYRTTRWRLKRRLDSAERTITELRGPTVVEAGPVFTKDDALPPVAAPMAAPPAMS